MSEKYGRWTVLHDVEKKHDLRVVTARCECGTIRDVYVGNLVSGRSTSCGCWGKERVSKFMKEFWREYREGKHDKYTR
jgi:hypothetical protein